MNKIIKKLLILITLLPLITVGQNKFNKLFQKADTAFNKSSIWIESKYSKVDSSIINSKWKIIRTINVIINKNVQLNLIGWTFFI